MGLALSNAVNVTENFTPAYRPILTVQTAELCALLKLEVRLALRASTSLKVEDLADSAVVVCAVSGATYKSNSLHSRHGKKPDKSG